MGKVYKPKEIRKLIEADGWYFTEQEGSHIQFEHPVKKGKVTIPSHNEDLNQQPRPKGRGMLFLKRYWSRV